MVEDEFSTFIENGLIDESSIIEEYERVRKITEAVDIKHKLAVKLNFDNDAFFRNLPIWSKNLLSIVQDEDIYWYTSDFDDNGVYVGKLKTIIANIPLLFKLGVNDINIIDKSLSTFISFDTYAYAGKFYQELRLYGRYNKCYIGAIET